MKIRQVVQLLFQDRHWNVMMLGYRPFNIIIIGWVVGGALHKT
jgi:hypothetical protein